MKLLDNNLVKRFGDIMAKELVKLAIMGAQMVGRAFSKAVRQEILASQEAAKRNAQRSGTSKRISYVAFPRTLI